MDVEERVENGAVEGAARDLAGVYRYYELAKRAEWQVRDLPWGELPPTPEYKGSPQKLARRQDIWRSVITQQLQADELAVRDGDAALRDRARSRGEALLHDDGAGRVAPHRGVAEADPRGRAAWASATRISTSSPT